MQLWGGAPRPRLGGPRGRTCLCGNESPNPPEHGGSLDGVEESAYTSFVPPLLLAVALTLCGAASAEDFIGAETRAELAAVGTRAHEVGRTAWPPAECLALGTVGCYMAPQITAGAEPALLVYFRGFWRGHGDGRVPEGERLASSRQALDFYGLEAAAAQAGAVVLITASSDIPVTEKDITAIEAAMGVSFKKLHLAAHSGGYNGLFKSLSGLRQPDHIVMLDNFYFTDEAKAKLVQDKVRSGAVCSGFYTSHNEARWRDGFKNQVDCAVEKKDDLGHEGGVKACLGAYLTKGTCP